MTIKNDLTQKRGILVDARELFQRSSKRSCDVCVYIHDSYALCKLHCKPVNSTSALKCKDFRKR